MKLRKKQMKLRKNGITSPKNFPISRWKMHLSSVTISPLPRGVTSKLSQELYQICFLSSRTQGCSDLYRAAKSSEATGRTGHGGEG